MKYEQNKIAFYETCKKFIYDISRDAAAKTGPKRIKIKGESLALDNGKVTCIAWLDTKCVKVVSTQHSGQMETVTRRRKGGPGREEIQKPSAIVDYNR